MNTYRFTIVGKDATKKMFRSIKTGVKGVRSAVNSTQVKMAALAGAAGLGMVVKASLETIDTMAKMSDRLNITTEDLAAYHHLTQLNGESTDSFDKSLEKMTRSVGEAQRGLGTGRLAFQQLGIEIDEISKLDAGKQFEIISESISKVEGQTVKASLASDIFGRAGIKLLNTINQGAEGIASAREEVEKYGLSISRVDAAKIEDANDQMLRVGQVAKGLGQKLTVQLAPFISVISEKFVGAATEGNRMGKVITGAINFAVKAVSVFANGLHGVRIIFVGLKTIVNGFGAAAISIFNSIASAVVSVGRGIKLAFLNAFREVFEVAARFSDKAKESLASINAQLNEPAPVPAFIQTLDNAQGFLTEVMRENRAELQELLLADLPGAVIEQKWAEITAEAERRAKEVAVKAKEAGQNVGVDIQETDAEREKRESKLSLERERIAARLVMLDESHFTELERLQLKLDKEIEIIQLAEDQKLLTEDEARQKRLRADESFDKAKTKLVKTSETSRGVIIGKSLQLINNMSSTGSKKMFKTQKAASLAQAAVALPAAVIDSFRNAGGYPWGIIPAAAMLATGLSQIKQIKSQKFGGSGTVSGTSGGGGTPQTPTQQASGGIDPSIGSQFNQPATAKPQTIVNLSIAGDVVGDAAETILGKLKTLIEEGDAVLFSANSRQALELVPG